MTQSAAEFLGVEDTGTSQTKKQSAADFLGIEDQSKPKREQTIEPSENDQLKTPVGGGALPEHLIARTEDMFGKMMPKSIGDVVSAAEEPFKVLARPSIPGVSQMAEDVTKAKDASLDHIEDKIMASPIGQKYPKSTAALTAVAVGLTDGSLKPEDIPSQIGGIGAFEALGAIGEIFPNLAKPITEIGSKQVTYPAPPVRQVVPFERLKQLNAGAEPTPAERMVMQSEGQTITVKHPFFQFFDDLLKPKPKTTAMAKIGPESIYEPGQLDSLVKRDAKFSAPQVKLDETVLGKNGKEFLAKNFPETAKAVLDKTVPIDTAEAQEIVQKGVAAGIEAQIKGAPPQIADQAAARAISSGLSEAGKTPSPSSVLPSATGPTPQPKAPPAAVMQTAEDFLNVGKRAEPNPRAAELAKAMGVDPHMMPLDQYAEIHGAGRDPAVVRAEHLKLVGEAANRGEIVPNHVLSEYHPGLRSKMEEEGRFSEMQETTQEKAMAQRRGSVVDAVRELGGVKGYEEKFKGDTSALKSEFKEIPLNARGAHFLDEMADKIAAERPELGIQSESDLIHALIEEGKATRISAVARGRRAQGDFVQMHLDVQRRLRENQLSAKSAVQEILKSNKIDDQVVTKIVDHIAVDEDAFKSGYGTEYQKGQHEIRGATYPAGTRHRINTLIELAEGADRGTGRHEAFHAVTNLVLDQAEKNILLRKYGNWEKAAEEFANFRNEKGPHVEGLINRIFVKLRTFLDRILNYIRDRKWKTADDIFRDVEEGNLGGRTTSESSKSPGTDLPAYQEHQPTPADPGSSGGSELSPRNVFSLPEESASSSESITQHPEFFKSPEYAQLTSDAELVVLKYAKERGVEANQEFAMSLYNELHDAVTAARSSEIKTPGTYKEVDAKIKEKYPDVANEWITLRNKLQSDQTFRFFKMYVHKKYGPFRPKVVLEAEAKPQYEAHERSLAPTFYSTVERAVDLRVPEKGSPQQILAAIKNTPGVKQEELDWLGLDEWLKDKGTVTKKELQDFIKQNQVRIQEVTKGEEGEFDIDLLNSHQQQRYEILEDKAVRGDGLTPKESDEYDELEKIGKRSGGGVKFWQYQLPGGENYREMLLTMPQDIEHLWESGSPSAASVESLKPEFHSSHFDEPNVLAHVRFNDRVDADGKKVLFLEEVQSDWHQRGRDTGYIGKETEETKKLESEREKLSGEVVDLSQDNGADMTNPEVEKRMDRINEINERLDVLGRRGGAVPDAPFKKTWPELVIKRMLRHAAENGYDKIAWTTGEQQAERYDLSQKIELVRYNTKTNKLTAYPVTDDEFEHGEPAIDETVPPEKLADFVGKEVAEKLRTAKPKKNGNVELDRPDLKVGGEGMKGFYDQIIPSFLNKYTKKWGGRVGNSRVPTEVPTELNPVTNWLLENDIDMDDPDAISIDNLVLNHAPKFVIDGVERGDYESEPDVSRKPKLETVHSLDITPSMKESVLHEGQPQYQAVPARVNPTQYEAVNNGDLKQSDLPTRRKEPKPLTEMAALRRSLQRQSAAAAEGARGMRDFLTEFKTNLTTIIKDALPETERGAFLNRLARASTSTDGLKLLADVQAKQRILRKTGPRDITEKEALERSLQRQDAAAKEAIRGEQKRLADLKKGLIENIQKNLPPAERGRFLTMIANAKTEKDMIKGIQRINDTAAKYQNRMLVHAVRREFQRTLASKAIAIDYTGKVRELMNEAFNRPALQGPSLKPMSASLTKIAKMQKFIDDQRKTGANVYVPQYVLDTLRTLHAKPLRDFSTAELEDVLSNIRTLADLGRTKLVTMKNLDILRKQNDLHDLAAGTVPLTKRPIARALPGQSLPALQGALNLLNKGMNLAEKINFAVMPVDIILDIMDGNANYQGANYRIFKKSLDAKFGAYLEESSKLRQDANALAKRLNLSEKNFERIGVHGIRVQEDGYEKLHNNGMTDAQIDAIRLTPQEMEFYRWMRGKLDEMRPRIAQVMKDTYNKEMGQVSQYFPFVTDYELLPEDSDRSIEDRIEQEMIRSKNVRQGFTKSRIGPGGQKVMVDAMRVFQKHMDDVTYLTNLGPHIKYLAELAKSPHYQEIAGDFGQILIRDWLDTMAKKGGGLGALQIRWLDILRRNVGQSTLAFKAATALIHITPAFTSGALIGQYAPQGLVTVAVSKKWRQFVMKNFPEIKERIGDDPSFAEFTYSNIAQIGFNPLRKISQVAAAGAAAGSYMKYMDEHDLPVDFEKPNKEAILYAENVVRRSQGSPFFKDSPLALTTNRYGNQSINKMILQFQNFILYQWRLPGHEMWDLGLKKGTAKGAVHSANVLFWLGMAAMLRAGIRYGWNEVENWATGQQSKPGDFERRAEREMLETIPFLGHIESVLSYGGEPAPVLDALKHALGGRDYPKQKRSWLTTIEGWAQLSGVPGTTQAVSVIKKQIGKKEPEYLK